MKNQMRNKTVPALLLSLLSVSALSFGSVPQASAAQSDKNSKRCEEMAQGYAKAILTFETSTNSANDLSSTVEKYESVNDDTDRVDLVVTDSIERTFRFSLTLDNTHCVLVELKRK